LIAGLVYAQSLRFGFVWDDRVVIEQQISAFQSLEDAFFPEKGVHGLSQRSYRPMVYASYLWDTFFWKVDPFGFHLTNLFFHLGNTILIFFLGKTLIGDASVGRWVGFWASLFFAVHPAHVESVAWVSGRGDMMALCFFLVSFLLFLKFAERNAWLFLWSASFFYLLSILSKEATLLLVFLFPLVFWGKDRGAIHWKDLLMMGLPFLVSLGIWAIMRSVALGEVTPSVDFQWPTLSALWMEGWFASGFYLKLLLWPFHLSAFPNLPHTLFLGMFAFISVAISIGLLVLAIQKRRVDPSLLLMGWWWMGLAPALLISASFPATPVAERYIYIPSAGGILLLAYWIGVGAGKMSFSWKILPILLIPVAWMGFQSLARTPVWESDLRFWEATVREIPERWGSHQNLALAYSEEGRFQEAENEFLKALGLTNDNHERQQTLTSLGIDALKQKAYEKAKIHLKGALTYDEASAYLQYNLGFLYQVDPGTHSMTADTNQLKKAVYHFEKALEYNPFYIDAFLAAGSLRRVLGDEVLAREHLNKVVELGPPGAEKVQTAKRQMALMDVLKANGFVQKGETDRAMVLYRVAIEKDPGFAEAHYQLANLLLSKGSVEEALGHLRAAVQRKGTFAEAYYQLGQIYTQKKQYQLAIESYQFFLQHWKGDSLLLDRVKTEVSRLEQLGR